MDGCTDRYIDRQGERERSHLLVQVQNVPDGGHHVEIPCWAWDWDWSRGQSQELGA